MGHSLQFIVKKLLGDSIYNFKLYNFKQRLYAIRFQHKYGLLLELKSDFQIEKLKNIGT